VHLLVLIISDPYHLFIISRLILLRMRNISEKVAQKIKTHILCPVTVLCKSRRLWDNMEIYCTAGQDTHDNMEHENCMLDTQSYKHTHSHYVILTLLHCINGGKSALQCYVIRTLPVLHTVHGRIKTLSLPTATIY
jgi:hypothetical protein